MLRNDQAGGGKILGEQLAQLQGAGTGLSPADFFKQMAPGYGGDLYYKNAETLGYYVGAMRAGIDKLNTDGTKTGAIVKSILSASISAASMGRVSGTVSGLTSLMVDQAVEEANGERTKLAQALQTLAFPVDVNGKRYHGPATSVFDSKVELVRHQ